MKTNELRLGNWIKNSPENYAKVTALNKHNVYTTEKSGKCICDYEFEIQPIELTEEVLLKIGFVKENEVNRMYNNRCVVSYYIGNFYKELVIEVRRENGFYKNNIVHYDIKYLHQLQNAYYCLTSEELEVEL